jgi:hypothetical protein
MFFSNYNPIWKDFLHNEELPPIPLSIVWASYNKKQLLEAKFKTQLPNCVNKNELFVSYAACCALKYVVPEQRSILFSGCANINAADLSDISMKRAAASYIRLIIQKRQKDDWLSYIISDYITMSLDLRRSVNLLLGKKGYKRLHDELTVATRLKSQRKKMKIPKNKLSKLVLPKDFKRITTNKDLIAESVANNNCVHSYLEKINKGQCLIYTLDYNKEHCTIEITLKNNKYNVNQITKKYNQPVSQETKKYIEEAIKQAISKNKA